MNKQRHALLPWSLVALLALGGCGGGGSATPQPAPATDGLPAWEDYSEAVVLPHSGQSLLRTKEYDAASDTVIIRTLDENGQPVDFEALMDADRQAYYAEHGALRPDLVEYLDPLDPQSVVEIGVFLQVDGLSEQDRDNPDPTAIDLDRTRIRDAQGLVADAITRLGGDVTEFAGVPFMVARMTVANVRLLAFEPGVAGIFRHEQPVPGTVYEEGSRNGWKRAVRLDYGHGLLGAGIKIGNAEPGNLIDANSETVGGLHPTFHSAPEVMVPSSPLGAKPPHLTQTSEVIAGDAPPYGVAPRAQLLLGNAGQLLGEIWATQEGADVISSSMFWYHAGRRRQLSDYMADWLASHPPWPLFTLIAGNRTLIDPAMPSKGYSYEVGNLAYNAMIVGATDYRGTDDRSDDRMTDFSCWVNPISTHGDRELPSIVAPGQDVQTALYSNLAGTSFAAPIVAGAAALVLENARGRLRHWPEAVRALLLATARQEIDGTSIAWGLHGLPDQADGVGELDVQRAIDASNTELSRTSINSPGTGYAKGSTGVGRDAASFLVRNDGGAPRWARVALVWTHRIRCVFCHDDSLSTDLDLQVVENDTGYLVRWSQTMDSSFEALEFRMDPHKTYKIRVRNLSASSTWFGLAVDVL